MHAPSFDPPVPVPYAHALCRRCQRPITVEQFVDERCPGREDA